MERERSVPTTIYTNLYTGNWLGLAATWNWKWRYGGRAGTTLDAGPLHQRLDPIVEPLRFIVWTTPPQTHLDERLISKANLRRSEETMTLITGSTFHRHFPGLSFATLSYSRLPLRLETEYMNTECFLFCFFTLFPVSPGPYWLSFWII